MKEKEQLYPSRAVRDRFGVSEMTLYRWVEKGILPSPTKINGRNYWPESAVDAVASGKAPQTQAAA